MTDPMLVATAKSGAPGSGGGVVQVNFFSGFVSQEYRDAWKDLRPEIHRATAEARAKAQADGAELTFSQADAIERAYMDRITRPPFARLIDTIDHIAKVAGVDHVGLGSDFDGVHGQLPEGLDSAGDIPKITQALLERDYTVDDCRKILGGNTLRVLREVETVGGLGRI